MLHAAALIQHAHQPLAAGGQAEGQAEGRAGRQGMNQVLGRQQAGKGAAMRSQRKPACQLACLHSAAARPRQQLAAAAHKTVGQAQPRRQGPHSRGSLGGEVGVVASLAALPLLLHLFHI